MRTVIISSVFAILLIAGAIYSKNNSQETNIASANNVRVENGVQIIEITAKGGYWPQKSMAKAGLPTIIRFKTSGTFDCSSSVSIPSIGLSKYLPQTGSTDIDLGTSKQQVLTGTCGMGMYPFSIVFN